MSPYFIFNNIDFALHFLGALVFAMTAWLAFDAYAIRKDFLTASRGLGFSFLALAEVMRSFHFESDTAGYLLYTTYLLGLVLVVWNLFLEKPVERPSLENQPTAVEKKPLNALLFLPSLAGAVVYFNFWNTLLLSAVAYLSYRQLVKEDKRSLKLFIISFSLLALGSLFAFFYTESEFEINWILGHILEVGGFIALAFWVWQYLQLRLREEMVLIFFSMALFISIAVTFAFSMILINQVENATAVSLASNAKAVNNLMLHLKEESLAKSRLFASSIGMREALAKSNFTRVDKEASDFSSRENLGLLVVAKSDGEVIARAGGLIGKGETLADNGNFKKAIAGYSIATTEYTSQDKLAIKSFSPVFSGNKIAGVVIAGFVMDEPFADNLKKTTGMDISMINGNEIVASTILAPDGRTSISGTVVTDALVASEVSGKGNALTLRMDFVGKPYISSFFPLKNLDGKIIGMTSVSKSQREMYEIARSTNMLTLVSVIIIMFILAYPIFKITKSLLE